MGHPLNLAAATFRERKHLRRMIAAQRQATEAMCGQEKCPGSSKTIKDQITWTSRVADEFLSKHIRLLPGVIALPLTAIGCVEPHRAHLLK